MKNKNILLIAACFLFASLFGYAPKDQPKGKDSDLGDYTERAQKAAGALSEIMAAPDKGLPRELLDRAHAIAVIPNVVKGAFGIGGRYGKGLVSKRTRSGWGTPAFVNIGGGSFGLQIGVTSTDLILVFTEEEGLRALLKDKLKLGVDASVAAGPVGRTAEAGVNATFDAAVYSYSRSKGLFAGVALDGAVLNINDSANQKVYGRGITGSDILLSGKVAPNPTVRPFIRALESHAPHRNKK